MDLHRLTLPCLALTLSVSLLAGCQTATEDQAPPESGFADLVLVNDGRIVTVDDDRPEAEALAARGETVLAVGPRSEIESWIGPDTEILDLEWRLAVPGFIEGHGHFLGLGDSRIQLDLRSAASWDEIVAMVEAAVTGAEPGDWIRGRGWHQDKSASRTPAPPSRTSTSCAGSPPAEPLG